MLLHTVITSCVSLASLVPVNRNAIGSVGYRCYQTKPVAMTITDA